MMQDDYARDNHKPNEIKNSLFELGLVLKIKELESKLAKARDALEWYANRNNWDPSGIPWQNQTVRDYGSKAKEALKEIE